MDFDGFLVQMRIELDGIERVAAPLWALAVPASVPASVPEAPGGDGIAAVADEAGH